MSSAKCSFSSIVGGICSFDPKDKRKSTEIVPLVTCDRDISTHTSLWSISDVKTEVQLILARASILSPPEENTSLTICQSHRASLGIGWCRGSQRCRIPKEISNHESGGRQWPKAERGIGRGVPCFILKRTGAFITPGSG